MEAVHQIQDVMTLAPTRKRCTLDDELDILYRAAASHRPYPNRDRALRQIDRHIDEGRLMIMDDPHAVTPFGQRLIEGADAAALAVGSSLAASFAKMLPPVKQAPPVDTYRLSTRSSCPPGPPTPVVSGRP